MYRLANISAFEGLQVKANSAMGLTSAMSVFNADYAPVNWIIDTLKKHSILQSIYKDVRSNYKNAAAWFKGGISIPGWVSTDDFREAYNALADEMVASGYEITVDGLTNAIYAEVGRDLERFIASLDNPGPPPHRPVVTGYDFYNDDVEGLEGHGADRKLEAWKWVKEEYAEPLYNMASDIAFDIRDAEIYED